MVESFKGLDNILRDWAKDKTKKVFSRNSTSMRSIKKSFLENDLEKIPEHSQLAVEHETLVFK